MWIVSQLTYLTNDQNKSWTLLFINNIFIGYIITIKVMFGYWRSCITKELLTLLLKYNFDITKVLYMRNCVQVLFDHLISQFQYLFITNDLLFRKKKYVSYWEKALTDFSYWLLLIFLTDFIVCCITYFLTSDWNFLDELAIIESQLTIK